MTSIPLIEIPYEELKSLVITSIKKQGNSFQFSNLCNSIGAIAVEKEIVQNPHEPNFQAIYFPLQKRDENRVREILWDLIIERVITIGDYQNDSWPHLSLTDYGQRVLDSEEPVPNDPSEYLKRIKKEIPELDNIIETYLAESVRTYNINQLLSATITLGCASEKALLLLIDTFRDTFEDTVKQERFRKKIEGKFIKTQFDELNKELQFIKGSLPYELKDNYTNTLIGIFEMIRSNRNQAGHPTGKKIDKDTLFANLQVFIPYCKLIYNLKGYFNDHKH
ncbi:hypothetical protein GQR60_13145 [Labilibaculum sp. A4]|uniref:hypothetical protein n=1 Tax=Labilibaculum euxinus TaxID=2686357 RepID=UPI000F6218F8|nr:hypothetical protein [Labilibaculum euxinus]MDQ1771723.1 hypothetical protein [Labilibaculum euxinus]MWN77288.1 hypothetical protein [Labilibaculum euxinus]